MKRLLNIKAVLPLLALLVVVGVAPTAKADALLPNTVALGPSNIVYVAAGNTVLGVANTAVVATNVNGISFTGTARAIVVRNAGGTLDFYYQFSNNGASQINRLTMGDFDGFTTDVFNVTNGATINGTAGCGACTFVGGTIDSFSADRDVSGNVVGFSYSGSGFIGGTSSFVVVIKTNATLFTAGDFNIINGATGNAPAFAPTAVPEPASMLLLGTGLVGVAGAVRRKLKTRNLN